jgi:hypothetical protein
VVVWLVTAVRRHSGQCGSVAAGVRREAEVLSQLSAALAGSCCRSPRLLMRRLQPRRDVRAQERRRSSHGDYGSSETAGRLRTPAQLAAAIAPRCSCDCGATTRKQQGLRQQPASADNIPAAACLPQSPPRTLCSDSKGTDATRGLAWLRVEGFKPAFKPAVIRDTCSETRHTGRARLLNPANASY